MDKNKPIKIILGNDNQVQAGDHVNIGINGSFTKVYYGEETEVSYEELKLLDEGGYRYKTVMF